MPEKKGGWMVGRTRHVRVYLTEEEHAVVRRAAAAADKSVSRFSVEAIVEAARGAELGQPPEPPAPRRKGR
jgi:uncharacterized protein (DUF1778 family)